ncbi:uncharacterized protein LTR77_009041 [Saxophila tyrrhenica]|uniref:SET domain-containing protein n=1 Tax=Saxophila tyrrhenica TaxID=1690608 RepID=A0AAV9P3I8_9PEZI|nr:hypothetical protein LTR77_009041 [Saxophila tyrrhenica]
MALVIRNGPGRTRERHGVVDESDGKTPLTNFASTKTGNLTVRHPLLELRLTPTTGLGLFAKCDVKRGSRLLSEAPLLLIPSSGPTTYQDLQQQLEKASPAEREALYGLQHDPELLSRNQVRQVRNYAVTIRKFAKDKDGLKSFVQTQAKAMAIFETNATKLVNKSGSAVFPLYSRINHSCTPNVYANYNPSLRTHTVHAIRDIEAGEEILTTYIDSSQFFAGRDEDLKKYGFECACAFCQSHEPSLLGPTTSDATKRDLRRAKINVVKRSLYAFEGEHARADGICAPRSPSEALDRAQDLIKLLREEGLLGMDLAQAYRWASKYSLQFGVLEKARDYAQKEAEVELCCLGPETDYMGGSGNAASWLKHVQATAEKDKVKLRACEKRMAKEVKRMEKKAEKKAKKR